MRGEKRAWLSRLGASRGSPPHARGKVCGIVAPILSVRITPACAGKREFPVYFDYEYEDHPRMRGEKRVSNGSKDW